jgi:hypothetical protein
MARLPLKAPIYWRLSLTGRGAAVSDHIDCAIHRMLRLKSLDIDAGGTLELPLGPEPGQPNRLKRIGGRIRTQRTNQGIGVLRPLERLS